MKAKKNPCKGASTPGERHRPIVISVNEDGDWVLTATIYWYINAKGEVVYVGQTYRALQTREAEHAADAARVARREKVGTRFHGALADAAAKHEQWTVRSTSKVFTCKVGEGDAGKQEMAKKCFEWMDEKEVRTGAAGGAGVLKRVERTMCT